MRKGACIFILLIIGNFVQAQQTKKSFFPSLKHYQQADFGSPVHIPVSLAGNFGECRPNHFHSGLDVRTQQRENLDIYAIGKGYISGVTISHNGFGNCIYISHPGGYTSVYAHCNSFYEVISRYVKSRQYKKEKWNVELRFPPHLFPIRKGQFIAKSGNTGSSHAPHLHMEIRETKTDKTLNGLLFYAKMKDEKKPIISRLGVYDASKSIYHQDPKIFKAIKKGHYDAPTSELIQVNSNKVYFGIQANDYMENSLRLGIFKMKLIVDDEVLFGWQLNRIGYNETRYMNAIGDYKTRMGKGFWLQLCHKLPNDQLGVYINGTQKNGIVDISDGKKHNVIIRVYDVKGNFKDIRFSVQQKDVPTYGLASCPGEVLAAGEKNRYRKDEIACDFPKDVLYDDVCMWSERTLNEKPYSYVYHVAHAGIPVHDYFKLRLKPKKEIPKKLRSKVAILYAPDDEMTEPVGQPATWKNGWVVASVNRFGNYEIVIDQTPPSIIPYFKNGTKVSKGTMLKFGAEDTISELKEVRMEVEGQWLRCVRRRNNYYYTVDEYFPDGKHELTLRAIDGNNNITLKKFVINR